MSWKEVEAAVNRFYSAFQSGLNNGGSVGLIYGFLFTWGGNILQTLVMAEMASMLIPDSLRLLVYLLTCCVGFLSQEASITGTRSLNMFRRSFANNNTRVAILSPSWCSNFLSYLTGWITVIAWQTGLASAAFLGGTMIQGLLVLNYETYEWQQWHGTLLFFAIVALSLFLNTYLARVLPKIEAMVLFVHIFGFFCILIPLVYLAPHGTAREVFTTFTNNGGWSSDAVSFFVGLTTSMLAFIGRYMVKRTGVLRLRYCRNRCSDSHG
jgi:choline transport protein